MKIFVRLPFSVLKMSKTKTHKDFSVLFPNRPGDDNPTGLGKITREAVKDHCTATTIKLDSAPERLRDGTVHEAALEWTSSAADFWLAHTVGGQKPTRAGQAP